MSIPLSGRRRRLLAAAGTATAVVGSALVLTPGVASGADGQVTAATAVARTCAAAPLAGAAGTATRTMRASADGLLRLGLAASGDWDVAAFDRSTGRLVASSAGFTGTEAAAGFVTAGQDLLVQACRQPGGASTAVLSSRLEAIAARAGTTLSVVEVDTRDRAAKARLQALGLDLTEHGTATTVEVVLHGQADADRLRAAGFTYRVEIADLGARSARNREADAAYAGATKRSELPSGRTNYRRLGDYEAEMKALASRFPDLVKPLTLPHRTAEGRQVHGIEITTGARNAADGKPVFLQLGVHHAREWPSAEHAMEFAYELLNGYGLDAQVTKVVQGTRTIVVPVVNPDGFTISREASAVGTKSSFGLADYEYKRKNCQISATTSAAYRGGSCADNPAGRLRGDDPNRNYGGFWGGAGASTSWSSDTFRGDAPFSAPEVQNVRELVSTRQVTNLITNHTYSNLVLRVPGVYAVRAPLEEAESKALGDLMASRNGYASQPSWALYDTTGSLEDWSFWNTGGLGYTFEIGPDEFHPPFKKGVVDEYVGAKGTAGAGGGGNRAAYLDMAEATLDATLHSTLTGTAPAGATLTIGKTFSSETSPVVQADGSTGAPLTYRDTLSSSLVSTGGAFSWAVNPSTRPIVAGRSGRTATGPAQGPIGLANPAGTPAVNTGDPLSGANESVPFTVQPGFDNETLTVSMRWARPETDWDLYVVDGAGRVVAQSANGDTVREDALLVQPPAGTYRAVLVNYAGGATDDWNSGAVAFSSPLPELRTGLTEAWQLTCTVGGVVKARQDVVVERGQSLLLGDACSMAAAKRR